MLTHEGEYIHEVREGADDGGQNHDRRPGGGGYNDVGDGLGDGLDGQGELLESRPHIFDAVPSNIPSTLNELFELGEQFLELFPHDRRNERREWYGKGRRRNTCGRGH